jgi:hypothetical protein
MGRVIADCQLEKFISKCSIGNWKSAIGNDPIHALPRDGSDLTTT